MKIKSKIKGKSIISTFSWVLRRLRSRILNSCRTLNQRIFVSNLLSVFVRRAKNNYPSDSIFKILDTGKHAKELSIDGYTIFDELLPKDLYEKIYNYLKSKKVYDVYHPEFGEFDFDKAPDQTHVAEFSREDLVNSINIIELANDPSILAITSKFLKREPTISNITAWWSYKGKKVAKEAQNFHRDNDDFKFCKLFIYLTDVDEDAGPHVYVRGTSKSPELMKIKRYDDNQIETSFGKENIVSFVAPKCSIFLVDTFGLHKGMLPFSNDRLLLQIEYSLFPIGYQDYNPIGMPNKAYSKFDKYVNRLLFKSY
jgi:hypothetical protein